MIRIGHPLSKHGGRRSRGFSLVEAMIATAILAFVAASASLPFAAGLQQVNESAELEQAVALGQALMEEVLARPFYEADARAPALGPEADEITRASFDNTDDFSGYVESSETLKSYDNATMTDKSLEGFWREVTVEYVTMPDQADWVQSALIHVQVKVYRDTTCLVTLDRLVARED